jgi:hypothetical protein
LTLTRLNCPVSSALSRWTSTIPPPLFIECPIKCFGVLPRFLVECMFFRLWTFHALLLWQWESRLSSYSHEPGSTKFGPHHARHEDVQNSTSACHFTIAKEWSRTQSMRMRGQSSKQQCIPLVADCRTPHLARGFGQSWQSAA